MIRDSARTFFDEHATLPAVRIAAASVGGYDAALWQQMVEFGWVGVAIPQAYGGSGLGCVELSILASEQGRRLVPSPWFPTVCLAAPLIRQLATDEQQARWLPQIAAGSLTACVALSGSTGGPDDYGAGVTFEHTSQGLRLTGAAHFVIGGASADLVLVVARDKSSGADALSVYALSPTLSGVVIKPQKMLDSTRSMATIQLNAVDVDRSALLGVAGGASAPLARVIDQARILLAAEAVGAAEWTLEAVTAHAKERIQFGRVIGSFQAVKHRLADMLVLVEAAKSMSWYAACANDELPEPEVRMAASSAKSYCVDALYNNAANAIQLYGGMGFTWDHHAHLYFRRARALTTLLGSSVWQRERLATLLGLGAAASVPQF